MLGVSPSCRLLNCSYSIKFLIFIFVDKNHGQLRELESIFTGYNL